MLMLVSGNIRYLRCLGRIRFDRSHLKNRLRGFAMHDIICLYPISGHRLSACLKNEISFPQVFDFGVDPT